MKLTKQECIKHFDNFLLILFNELDTHNIEGLTSKEQDKILDKLQDSCACFEQLIDEYFNNSLAGQVDKLKKDLDITCKLHDDLLENYNNQKKRMKQLEQENGKLKKQVHSYYMAMVTGKGE